MIFIFVLIGREGIPIDLTQHVDFPWYFQDLKLFVKTLKPRAEAEKRGSFFSTIMLSVPTPEKENDLEYDRSILIGSLKVMNTLKEEHFLELEKVQKFSN